MSRCLIALFSMIVLITPALFGAGSQEVGAAPDAGPVKLTYWSGLSGKVSATNKSLGDVESYKALQKNLGIEIEFLHPPAGLENEQFNLLVASRDYPDIIWWNWPKIPGGPSKAIDDEVIIPLTELINEQSPYLTKVFEQYPQARKESMLDDGTLFMYPFIKADPASKSYFGPQLRRDWLDTLGVSAPQTIPEWYTVLKAIRDGDPNGNGEKDEIPFVAAKQAGIHWFAGAWGITYNFYLSDGQVKYGPAQPEAKEYLATMRKWYKEGLIDPDFASTDGKQFDAKITGDRAGSFYGLSSGNMGRYLGLLLGKGTTFDLIATPWAIAPDGKRYNIHGAFASAVPGGGSAISTASKHVAEAVKVLDYGYGPEGHMLFNFGIEGESYKMVNGYPTYTDMVLNHPDGLAPALAGARYYATYGAPMVYDARYIQQIMSLKQQKDSMDIWLESDFSLLVPAISPPAEKSSRLAALMNEINTYTSEMFNKFVMGQESLDNFDAFVKRIGAMGIDEAIRINQDALAEYNKR